MCQGLMHEFLVALPKCEHHMHLEGSLEPSLLFELAARNNITLPKSTDSSFESPSTLLERYGRFTSLDDFLHYYFIGMSVLITPQDFESLAYTYFAKAHSQNVYHAEVFFDPQAHTSRGVPYTTVLSGIRAAQSRAQKDFNLTSELIVCVLRHFTPDECFTAYQEFFPDIKSGMIRGLGLSSTELNKHPAQFRQSYDHARENGIQYLTAHAGEEADVTYMAAAIHDLGVSRVDHGIKLPQDPDLMKYFAQNRILVTMCPMSNVELKAVKDLSQVPVKTYLDNGVPFSINSDDPAYFGGYIQENYCGVQETFGLTIDEWERIVRDSIELSWCGETRKQELLTSLKQVVAQYKEKSDS